MEVTFVEAFTEASVEETSAEVYVEALTEASVETTSVEVSTTKFRGSKFHGSFHGIPRKLSRVHAVEDSMEASTLPWKLPSLP